VLGLLPVFAVSIASVIGVLREPFVPFATNIAHRAVRLNPRNPEAGRLGSGRRPRRLAGLRAAAFRNPAALRCRRSSAAPTDTSISAWARVDRAGGPCRHEANGPSGQDPCWSNRSAVG